METDQMTAGAETLPSGQRPQGCARSRRVLLRAIVPFLVAVGVYCWWSTSTPEAFTGDEPHYVVTADSIVRFHTLDLRRAYSDADGVQRYLPGLLPNHGVDLRGDGYLAPLQGIGLPALIAPVWGITHSLRAVRFWLILVTALFAQQLYGLLFDIIPGRRLIAIAVWIGACLTLPVAAFSNQIYPEIPAALCIVLAVRFGLRISRRSFAWLASGALAVLPWLHVRYAVLAATGFAWLLYREVLTRGGHSREQRMRASVSRLLPYVVPVAASGLLLLILYLVIYGTALGPWRAYRTPPAIMPQQTFLQRYELGFGSLFSPTNGLITFGPTLLLGIVGVGAAFQRSWQTTVIFVVGASTYLFVIVPFGFFGTDLPGRFAIVLVPLFAVSMALLVGQRRVGQVGLAVLLLVSAWVLVNGHSRYLYLYTDPATIPPVSHVASVLPWSDRTRGIDSDTMTGANVVAGALSSDPGATLPTREQGSEALAAMWEGLRLRRASYSVRVDLRRSGASPASPPHVLLELDTSTGILGRTTVSERDFARGYATLRVRSPEIDLIVSPQMWTSDLDALPRVGRLSITRLTSAEPRDSLVRRTLPHAVALSVILLTATAFAARPSSARRGRSKHARVA